MPASTDTATHVYIKKENPTGLLQSYIGPYKIVDRPSASTIRVKLGTFKSGVENLQLHHWANCKPAAVRADTPEAQMPVRGRKPQQSSDTPTQSEVQTPTEASGADAPPQKENKPPQNKQAVGGKEPTRRSERIRARNHETSSMEVDSRAWTASRREIQTINEAISSQTI